MRIADVSHLSGAKVIFNLPTGNYSLSGKLESPFRIPVSIHGVRKSQAQPEKEEFGSLLCRVVGVQVPFARRVSEPRR
jgi:hypothetical protein